MKTHLQRPQPCLWASTLAGLVLLPLAALRGGAEPVPPYPGLAPGRFEAPVGEAEARAFPTRAVPGDLPADGLRYWSRPLWRLPYHGCYVTVLRRPGADGAVAYEMWENGWGPTIEDRGIRVQRGPSLPALGPPATVFDGRLIDDVPVPAAPRSLAAKEPWQLAPLRGFTRPYVHHDPATGYVLMACVCPDYQPGSVSLLPAILTSPDGQPGSWIYHGLLKGEPQEEQARLGRPVWSDGGSLFPLPDGRWRLYLNGFGQTLAVLHADAPTGPWSFLRHADGDIRELIPRLDGQPYPEGTAFPHVLRVADDEWHLWLSDGWPCQSIWHYWSRDGLAWEAYGRQPEITRQAVNGHGIKCLRTFLAADGSRILGLLSVWTEEPETGGKHWQLHLATLPVGPPPE